MYSTWEIVGPISTQKKLVTGVGPTDARGMLKDQSGHFPSPHGLARLEISVERVESPTGSGEPDEGRKEGKHNHRGSLGSMSVRPSVRAFVCGGRTETEPELGRGA